MSRRALWLACGALSVGFVVISCTSSDGSAEFDEMGGSDAGGESSTPGGTNNKGGTKAGGGSDAQGGNQPSGGVTSEAGAPSVGGSDAQGGEMGLGGDQGLGGDVSLGGDGNVAGMPSGSAGEGGTPSGEGGAGGAPVEGVACENFKACQEGEYCKKSSCDSKLGVCVMATRASDPVCGCDGVTYYSGALANTAEVDVQADGVCSAKVAVSCAEEKCAEGQTCGSVHLRGGTCDSKVAAVCWQLPKECPKELQEYSVCEKDSCSTLCNAIKTEGHVVPGGLNCSGPL